MVFTILLYLKFSLINVKSKFSNLYMYIIMTKVGQRKLYNIDQSIDLVKMYKFGSYCIDIVLQILIKTFY